MENLKRQEKNSGFEYDIAPELVKRIEKSKLTPDDKINILLTKAGLKPASEISLIIKTEHKGGVTEHMSEENVQEALNIIKALKLPFKLEERRVVKESYETRKEPGVEKFYQREKMNVLIGCSKEDLDFLISALRANSDELMGKAFGFPQTAIEAFIGKRERLDIKMLPKEIQKSDAVLFSSPTLSKDNWQEEIKQGRLIADFIKKISPVIYSERYAARYIEPGAHYKEMKAISLLRGID